MNIELLTENEQRAALLAEAETWLGTPFHFGQGLKGVGCDCARFIVGAIENCGLKKIQHDFNLFSGDWHFHSHEDHYAARVMRFAAKLPVGAQPLPGCIALARVGKSVEVNGSGGIIVQWPTVIFAHPSRGVVKRNIMRDPMWVGWPKEFFDPWRAPSVQE